MTLPRYFRHTPELPSCFRGIPMGFLWASYGFSVSLRLDFPVLIGPPSSRGASRGTSMGRSLDPGVLSGPLWCFHGTFSFPWCFH